MSVKCSVWVSVAIRHKWAIVNCQDIMMLALVAVFCSLPYLRKSWILVDNCYSSCDMNTLLLLFYIFFNSLFFCLHYFYYFLFCFVLFYFMQRKHYVTLMEIVYISCSNVLARREWMPLVCYAIWCESLYILAFIYICLLYSYIYSI